MKKRFLLILGIAAAVILLILIALPFLIDVDRFRPELESTASHALDRQVKLGHLSLSIFTGKVVADDIEVADDPTFSKADFVTAKSIRIGVELKPLIFSRQLNVTEVILESPQITILDGGNGTWNFSSLVGASQKNIDLSQAQPRSFSIGKFKVDNGRLSVKKVGSPDEPQVYDNFSVAFTNFSTTTVFPFDLETNLPGGGNASLSGTAGPISAIDVFSTPLTATLKSTNVNIAAFGLINPASGISGRVNVDETLQSDGTKAILAGGVTASDLKLLPTGPPSPRVISIRHNVEVELATHDGTIKQADISIGKAQLHATGTFKEEQNLRMVDFQLNGPKLPIDELQAMLPTLAVKLPAGSHLQGGEASVALRIKGSADAWAISGPVEASNFTMVGFNLASQLGSFMGLAGKTISSPDTSFRSLSLRVQMTKAGIQVDDLEIDVPSVGSSTGAGTISPTGDVKISMMGTPAGGLAGSLTKMGVAGGGESGTVPILLHGTLDKPVYTIDSSAAARAMSAHAVKGFVSVPIHAIEGLFNKKKSQPNK
jgi:AsmA protein